jgi:hypothetical protein
MRIIKINEVQGMQLNSIEYRIHEVQIDAQNSFTAAVFTLTFDQSMILLFYSNYYLIKSKFLIVVYCRH